MQGRTMPLQDIELQEKEKEKDVNHIMQFRKNQIISCLTILYLKLFTFT